MFKGLIKGGESGASGNGCGGCTDYAAYQAMGDGWAARGFRAAGKTGSPGWFCCGGTGGKYYDAWRTTADKEHAVFSLDRQKRLCYLGQHRHRVVPVQSMQVVQRACLLLFAP
jgi:hypothetical protein